MWFYYEWPIRYITSGPPGPDAELDYDLVETQPPKDADYDRDDSKGFDQTGNSWACCTISFPLCD